MISLQEAREFILRDTRRGPTVSRALVEAVDCVLAEDVVSPRALPAWDNSAVDGYAVRATDVAAATENNPIHLRVLGVIAAGESVSQVLAPHTCWRIFTGAPIPPGADAVVMQEATRVHHDGYVAVLESVTAGENVRRAGEDVAAGEVVLLAGTRLRSTHLGLASALGLTTLPVVAPPRVGVLTTGSELVAPGQPLQPGQIYESNGVTIGLLVRDCGAEWVSLGTAPDDPRVLRERVEEALARCDVLITCGGVSVGDHDHVKTVLAELGCTTRFWTVAMRPGKPLLFATRDDRLIFGLPGNPVSAVVTFLLLVRPALLRMRGLSNVELSQRIARAAEEFQNDGARVAFYRGLWDGEEVRSAGEQGSHVMSALARANCLVEIPACRTVRRGEPVTIWLLP
ncbi:MAG: molybdopterin molybdotransferase MoeA [Verrucomicrobiae bacterium]|nr:molybdopterin molybdotransferase MoeA [Verrucomicrobiae bacterium]MDW8344650.1 molybdopterin molybdotransferase MoeA [Verrucomicrobiae bacterium]